MAELRAKHRLLPSLLTAIVILTGCNSSERALSIADAGAAGFVKEDQQIYVMVGAEDGWAGTWVDEAVELYVYESAAVAEDGAMRFDAAVQPGNLSGWAERCVVLNVVMLSKGRNACRELEGLARNARQSPAADATSPTVSTEPSPSESDVEAQVEQRARTFAHQLVNFDYKDMESHLAWLRRLGTDQFGTRFHEALGGDLRSLEDAILGAEATSTGEVESVDVSLLRPKRATVVVVVSQTVRNRMHPAPRTELRPLELHMVATESGWEVDRVANVK